MSSNSIKITETSIDPDRIDNVKNGCFGGGHDGSPGVMKLSVGGNSGKLNVLVPLDGTPYEKVVVLNSGPNTSGAQPVVWFQYKVFDNNPLSATNNANKTQNNPTLAPIDGYFVDDWKSIPWDMNFDDSNINVLPTTTVTPTVTDLGGGSYRLTLTPQIIDPDAYDLTKNALFGGHGHDKTAQAAAKVFWGSASNKTTHWAILDNTDPNATWDTPMEKVFNNYSPGVKIWFQVLVMDAHYLDSVANAASPSYKSISGWQYVTAP